MKQWIRDNPTGSLSDMVDYCEEQIPPNQFATHEWLINQTIDWYKHILMHREVSESYDKEEDSIV